MNDGLVLVDDATLIPAVQAPASAPGAVAADAHPLPGLPNPLPERLTQRLGRAAKAPWRQGFIPLMRLLAAQHPELPPIGHSQRPQQEPFRLGQQASLAFAPREIAEISTRDGQAVIRLFGLGMLGPHGPLPLHVTEIVRERREARRDATLSQFLDLFHHRFLTLFYRAWAQAQSCAGLDRPEAETFTPYIARLSGDEVEEIPDNPLPPHARWASVAHRIREARNPDGLVATLANYFGIGVTLQEFQLHWIPIEAKDTCLIGLARPSSLLGLGALAGLENGQRLPLAVECDDLSLLRALALSTDTVIGSTDAGSLADVQAGRLVRLDIAGMPAVHSDMAIVSLHGRSFSRMAQFAVNHLMAQARTPDCP